MTNGVGRIGTTLARLGLGLWLTTTACAHGGYLAGPPFGDTCGTPEFREFDFWIGEWRVEQQMRGQNDEWLALPARTVVAVSSDGCLVTEHWTGLVQFSWDGMTAPEPMWGFSVRHFDSRTRQWRIFWMDQRTPAFGGPFTGRFEGGRGEFRRALETPVGPRLGRIVFQRIDADHVDWELGVSADDGATWMSLWAMRMVRDADGARTHVPWRDVDGAGQARVRETRQGAEFTVLPGVTFGRISEHTSRTDLQSLGSGVAVRDTNVELGEGFCTPGTRVYDGTPSVLDLAWQDEARTRVAFVRTSGERWATPRGVRVGATLRTLERMAGAPLTYAGFGWDHGGRLEWQEGRGSLTLYLHIDRSRSGVDSSAFVDPSVMGDVPLRSDLPAVRRVPIVVGRLAMTWGEPYDQRDCEQAAMEQPRR